MACYLFISIVALRRKQVFGRQRLSLFFAFYCLSIIPNPLISLLLFFFLQLCAFSCAGIRHTHALKGQSSFFFFVCVVQQLLLKRKRKRK